MLTVLLANVAVYSGGDAGRESPFTFGAGARGMGMGRAFAALSGDASSPFWNPAASASVDRTEFMAFHTSLFLDTQYDCFGISYPLELGVFSVSAGRLGSDNIIQRDLNNIVTGEFSSAESQYGISYARNVGFGVSGGLGIKAANQRIGGFSGTGFGADFGLQYRPRVADGLTLGLAVNDLLSPAIKLESAEDKYKPLSRFGIAYSRDLKNNISSLISMELDKTSGKSAGFHGGLEMEFYKQFMLRAGLDRGKIALGGGLVYRFVKIDYAFENVEYLGASHRISFGFTFGKSLSAERTDARANIIEQEKQNWINSIGRENAARSLELISIGDSLRGLQRYDHALSRYQRALLLDSTSTRARMMADSMIILVMERAVSTAGDEKRQELIAGRLGSALNDYKSGNYNESISKLNLLLEIDPGNESVTDLLNTVRGTRSKEIADRARIARRYQSEGNYPAALTEWNRLLTLERTNREAAEAIMSVNKEIEADRLISDAVSALRDRRFTDAVDNLNKARDIRPESETIKALINEAAAKSAPPTTLENIRSSRENWSKYLSGLENYQSADYAAALRIWEDLRVIYPNNAELDKNIDQARQRLSAEGGR